MRDYLDSWNLIYHHSKTDNLLSIKNSERLTPSKKVDAVIEELKAGNWSHVKIRKKELDFEIRINNRTQKFLTFENDYFSDLHLVKAVDYLATKILKAEDLANQRQTRLKSFTADIGT